MRLRDCGSTYVVTVSTFEVYKFNQSWPCSTLKGAQSFEFQKSNGDLVDRHGAGDGPEAVALSHDAQQYGLKALNHKRNLVLRRSLRPTRE